MTVCSKISGQKDRYMLRMHRTRDRVFLLTSCLDRQTSTESGTHCCEVRIASCLLVTINLIGRFPPPPPNTQSENSLVKIYLALIR
jgi:hypothetical protein